MNLKPFFRYYGGKFRVAPKYAAPKHDTIIEPFAGSAGYSVRYHDRNIILVEKDPVLVGVWSYLIKASPAEILALPDVPPGTSVDDYGLCQEARWFVGFWMNRVQHVPVKHFLRGVGCIWTVRILHTDQTRHGARWFAAGLQSR